MGKYTGISSECAVPMESGNSDRSRSRPPIFAQVVIGTPGTIKRLMSQKKLSVIDMKVLVFDEADHMLAKVHFLYCLCLYSGLVAILIYSTRPLPPLNF